MATTAPHSRAGLPSELTGLLPVLLDEISRLKRLHSLAGITELPVKDAVVRQELALLRSDFAQIKSFFSGAAGAMMTAGTNQAQATEAAASKNEDAKSSPAFGQVAQSAEFLPATRPRMNSVNVSGMLALPDGCDTHFFLVRTTSSINCLACLQRLIELSKHIAEPFSGDRIGPGSDAGARAATAGLQILGELESFVWF